MKRLSIGSRLTLWYLILFAAAQILFGAGMWLLLRRDLYHAADSALIIQIDDLTHFLSAQNTNATVAKLREEVSEAYVLEHSGDFLQVYDTNGDCIFRASALEQNHFAPAVPSATDSPAFQNATLGVKPFRFITQRLSIGGRGFIAQTGVPTDYILATLSMFRRYLLFLAPVLLLIAASVGYWISHQALAPVDALTRTARGIGGGNMSGRLEKLSTGDELQRLSDTLNEMLERIEDAFLRVTQFTADASHELRTPISLIRTEAEITLRKPRGDYEYCEALRNILHEATRTSVLVEELLSLARIDAGKESLGVAELDLNTMMTQTANGWRTLIEGHGLRFSLLVPRGQLLVIADCRAIERLVAVLLDNAVKYTPAPGWIELGLEVRNKHAVITVRDSGVGIAAEDQLKIFERFYRVDRARSRELGGAGIGLAIANWIAQEHRGSISVESSPGKGSTFLVDLPLLKASPGLDLSSEFVA